ncbi:ABC transporter permease [Haloechinothrix sp. YIM 98757]|uniref:ABC transporter permease n=1 Tax=Haloechinothrix aidingensis TaxID=2752311 RepID=A0A838AAX9_9PSEU|nr:ABC transporter permease [Haloechinothrix aidingensis]MBA0126402.1 ABC transporter permease [Haloechinothrix aidingensis]
MTGTALHQPQAVEHRQARQGVAASEWMLERRWPVALAGAVTLLALWQLYGSTVGLPEYILTPVEIARSAAELTASGRLVELASASLRRLVFGFTIGTATGVLLGLLSGVSRKLGDLLDGPVSLTYPIPKITFLPIIAIWLGFSDPARIIVIAAACFFPAYLNAHAATRSVDQSLVWVAMNAGAGKLRTLMQVVLPAALPRTVAGIRQALALAFIFMFATEAIGSGTGTDAGLGGEMFAARTTGEYEVLWAALATVALLGGTVDATFRWLVGKLMIGQELEAGRG